MIARDPIATPRGRSAVPAPASEAPLAWLRAWVQRALLRPLFAATFAPFEVHGLAHLESLAGPAIFAANHSSHLDTLAVVSALPAGRRVTLRVAAAEDYFYASAARRLAVSALFATYPFRRVGNPRRSLRLTCELIASGHSILLFPEGSRDSGESIGDFRNGISLIASRTGVPVIPTRVDGTSLALPKGARLPRRRPVSVSFGAPLRVGAGCRKDALAELVRERVIDLGREGARG